MDDLLILNCKSKFKCAGSPKAGSRDSVFQSNSIGHEAWSPQKGKRLPPYRRSMSDTELSVYSPLTSLELSHCPPSWHAEFLLIFEDLPQTAAHSFSRKG